MARLNIDADIANADWPKRTPDRMQDLEQPDLQARAAAFHARRARKPGDGMDSVKPHEPKSSAR
jgi:hypothetical protein